MWFTLRSNAQMPFGLLHRRRTAFVTVATQCALSLWTRTTRTENALSSRFRHIVKEWRWTRGDVQVFQVQLGSFILNPFVVNNQVIGNGQLIMWIATQQGMLNLFIGYAEFLCTGNNYLHVWYKGKQIYLTNFIDSINVDKRCITPSWTWKPETRKEFILTISNY